MIIRRLELENIRSYRRAKVEFPLGKTLFEGDIGSGKSTLLMAIEFALFGFGTEAGGSMLRAGCSEGKVAMDFETDGGEYRVERGLVRKGRGIQQSNGVLRTPEGDLDLSPSELKEKMLEVLHFNEAPDPRAQSWIYRYAVYTPQEEMKAVLGLSPDLRLMVLRRAFGIEDYKTAAENATNLAKEIRRKASEFEGMSRGVQELKTKLVEAERQREIDSKKAVEAKKKEEEVEGDLRRLREKKDQLREKELDLRRTEDEIKLFEKTADERRQSATEEREASNDVGKKIEDLNFKARELKRSKPPTKLTLAKLDERVEELGKKLEELTALKARLASKIEDYHTILENGRCPVCDRPVEAREFAEKEKAKRTEQSHVARELVEAKAEEREMRKLSKEMLEYGLKVKEMKGIELDLKRYGAELKRSRERAAKAEEEARQAELKVEEMSSNVAPLAAVSREVAEMAREIETVEKRLSELRDSLSRILEGVEFAKRDAEDTRKEIAEREEAARRRDLMQEHGLWLTDYFVPTLQLVEKSVMQSLNQELDSVFQGWFTALIDDPSKEARVDENFTPIVRQDGYEQDVYYLSGGEKTSVSLAYRLALNSLVRRVSTANSNILIMDEPTDGFSKEQLGSVREVLDEVECKQVIVVSHEKELESFADQVYKVVKENGESRVLAGGA